MVDAVTDGTEGSQLGIDTSVAHPARRYNYWLGGKDNFAADRESGDEFVRQFPSIRTGARACSTPLTSGHANSAVMNTIDGRISQSLRSLRFSFLRSESTRSECACLELV